MPISSIMMAVPHARQSLIGLVMTGLQFALLSVEMALGKDMSSVMTVTKRRMTAALIANQSMGGIALEVHRCVRLYVEMTGS